MKHLFIATIIFGLATGYALGNTTTETTINPDGTMTTCIITCSGGHCDRICM